MTVSLRNLAIVVPLDGRQSARALAIARGTARLLSAMGFAALAEMPLPSGRRADLVAINDAGEIWIVEIKSSREDLRADHKWTDYRAHCDRLFFAFAADMPAALCPHQTGLIVADSHGGQMLCEAPLQRLAPATRKAMLVRFGQTAALRLARLSDPYEAS